MLESEVRHFRRLSDGHADKNYQWLRDMIDKVLQLEKEDKNQAALQASHRAPVGGHNSAAAKGKEGKGGKGDKNGKGKGDKPKGGKGQGGDLANHLARTHHAEIAPQPLKSPAGFCSCTETAAKGTTATTHTGRQRRRNSRSSSGPSQVAAPRVSGCHSQQGQAMLCPWTGYLQIWR